MRAYNNTGSKVWDPLATAGDWNSFFAQPNGSLARRLSELVLVSDYEITVTSHTTYEQSEVARFEAGVQGGVWPFFSGSPAATHNTEIKHNEDNTLSVKHTLEGSPQIRGITYQNAPNQRRSS
ncbi:hypothetical protein FNQ90_11865 [Streptomyces alkaliphilus]|uniref:Uncharacterized protein n=1 Tax=Streptomyces alkaliphilus TaxID=1472722 RepID=A0A7W3Y1Z0_9ACTN|nr:hypothetical protein [Streptomyces alkaliphilus]MBB0244782.1 hypothetical protein [Streptomyces alkaliphilus]